MNDGSGAQSLVANVYDMWATTAYGAPLLHDSTNYGPGLLYRGNVSRRETGSGTTITYHLTTGVASIVTSEAGVTINSATSGATNYSLPETITPGGNGNLATSIGYHSSWGVTSVTGANGANSTTTYDSYGRPVSSKIPDGAITNYTYTYNPNTQTATLGSRWTKTTLDGFGRAVKVETGNGGNTVSVAETEYGPCACSPLAKVKRTARPHVQGGTPQWTTYTYDGMGRTLTVTLADGSVTATEYLGNTVKVTDAAGKWKKQTTDALGNLVQVTEPRPGGGADYVTTYQYNLVNQLTRVEMPRPYGQGTYTQVRTFTWSYRSAWPFNGPGSKMTSETNPETGTITYQYDSANRLTQRIDAKNQKTTYTYDAYGRLTQKRYFYPLSAWPNWTEDVDQMVTYRYDSNPIDGQYTQNGWGRLTAVEFAGPNMTRGRLGVKQMYSYNQAGRIVKQRMQIYAAAGTQPDPNNPSVDIPANLDAAYQWDNEGRMTSLQGPDNGPLQSYTYDAMGRLSSGGATYGPAGELLTFNGVTRLYNALGQLTRMTKAGVMDMEYRYTATQNNGRIWQSKDHVTGEEVTYQYDALNRLTAASTTDTAWGNAYTYDGWGNLTGKSVTKGTAPTYSQAYDPALNMPVGSNPPSHTAPYPYLEPYDIEDRTLYGKAEATPDGYGGMEQGRLRYEPSGRKLFWNKDGESGYPNPTERCEIYFYSITGQRLARYKCAYNQNEYEGPYHFGVWLVDRNQHIGGQLTSDGGKAVTTDRLGSTRAKDAERYTYFPYGEPRTATVSGGGLYAGLENPLRVYDAGSGRFNRPDPLGLGAVKLGDPGSWNRFAYVQGDPVNYADPLGLDRGSADDCTQMSETPCAASLDGGGDIFTNPSIGGWGLGTGFGPGAIAIPIGGVICVGSGVCEIVAVAAGGAAAGTVVWAGLRWIFSSSTDWKAGSFPTTEEIQKNCTPVGPPTKVPSTRRGNRDGGQSIEQEYICPDGSSYTIHTVTDNNGNIMDQHPRPGGPKYGPRPPGRLK